MKCAECRYWFPLNKVHDAAEWRNCLALPYPQCVETMMRCDAECVVPDKCLPKEQPRADEKSI